MAGPDISQKSSRIVGNNIQTQAPVPGPDNHSAGQARPRPTCPMNALRQRALEHRAVQELLQTERLGQRGSKYASEAVGYGRIRAGQSTTRDCVRQEGL